MRWRELPSELAQYMAKIVKQVSVELACLHSRDPEEHKPLVGIRAALACVLISLCTGPCGGWLRALVLCAPCLHLFLALPRTTHSLFTEDWSAFGICLRLSCLCSSPNAQIIRYLEKGRWLKTHNIKSPSLCKVECKGTYRCSGTVERSRITTGKSLSKSN